LPGISTGPLKVAITFWFAGIAVAFGVSPLSAIVNTATTVSTNRCCLPLIPAAYRWIPMTLLEATPLDNSLSDIIGSSFPCSTASWLPRCSERRSLPPGRVSPRVRWRLSVVYCRPCATCLESQMALSDEESSTEARTAGSSVGVYLQNTLRRPVDFPLVAIMHFPVCKTVSIRLRSAPWLLSATLETEAAYATWLASRPSFVQK
jgi:hypothetical protein